MLSANVRMQMIDASRHQRPIELGLPNFLAVERSLLKALTETLQTSNKEGMNGACVVHTYLIVGTGLPIVAQEGRR